MCIPANLTVVQVVIDYTLVTASARCLSCIRIYQTVDAGYGAMHCSPSVPPNKKVALQTAGSAYRTALSDTVVVEYLFRGVDMSVIGLTT